MNNVHWVSALIDWFPSIPRKQGNIVQQCTIVPTLRGGFHTQKTRIANLEGWWTVNRSNERTWWPRHSFLASCLRTFSFYIIFPFRLIGCAHFDFSFYCPLMLASCCTDLLNILIVLLPFPFIFISNLPCLCAASGRGSWAFSWLFLWHQTWKSSASRNSSKITSTMHWQESSWCMTAIWSKSWAS